MSNSFYTTFEIILKKKENIKLERMVMKYQNTNCSYYGFDRSDFLFVRIILIILIQITFFLLYVQHFLKTLKVLKYKVNH